MSGGFTKKKRRKLGVYFESQPDFGFYQKLPTSSVNWQMSVNCPCNRRHYCFLCFIRFASFLNEMNQADQSMSDQHWNICILWIYYLTVMKVNYDKRNIKKDVKYIERWLQKMFHKKSIENFHWSTLTNQTQT